MYKFHDRPLTVKCLDISTGHLCLKDKQLLDDAVKGESENPMVAYEYEYGYFVYVPDDDTNIKEYGYSQEYINILDTARKQGCKYIQYDGEGIVYEDLPTYEWIFAQGQYVHAIPLKNMDQDWVQQCPTKRYNIMENVGKVKYLINFHDGVKTHTDGSPFYDIRTFKNKVDLSKFEQKLLKEGYKYRTGV